VSEDVYLRLYRELNASRFDSPEANAAIEQLGAPARTIRGLARARRHAWGSARVDLRAAVEARDVAPIVELVAAVGLFIARDYDFALTALGRAAARGKPGIAKQARLYALRFASALGWTQEARELERALGSTPTPEPEPANHDELEATAAHVRFDLLHERVDEAAARLAALRPEQRERLPAERAALALIRGDASEAMVRTTHPRNDPRLLYLRARALMLLGEHSEASELLEQARVALPRSVPIVLALALARHREAPDTFGEGLERRFEDLLDWAPGLLSDAAAELDVVLWTDQGVVIERATKVAILERSDRLLTREAELVGPHYRCRDHLRHIPPAALHGPSPLTLLHAEDRKLIDHVDGVLVRALGIKPPRPEIADRHESIHSTRTVWQPRTLSPAQIEQFLVDGFIIVPRAFDPEIARAWREDANRRIREQPEKWVRGYDPNDEARSLRLYSPDDPSTWTWGRVDLDGPETVIIEEFAPAAWGAICDLLGGPDRIKTHTWTNYLIVNFCADAHLGFDAPAPDWSSWHIDDPSPMTRLDRIQNGLVGIALFDRLLPRSGNTWIAPDSVGRVARELAAHPEGVDFVANRGNRITMQCERFHEVVGEAGDVLLMHPLMMHSSSPNRSGRIRWMGNPMIYLHEPLDPFRPVEAMSPVELAIHRAIG
jgi:tetratricopeptide (TPR) repeat protein